MKIIAFPFAGGNKYSFRDFEKSFSKKGIKFISLEYAGRGNRIQEPFFSSLDELVDDSFLALKKLINPNENYMVYGHSMGALVGYLVCHKIMNGNTLKNPIKLIVSGRGAPTSTYKKNDKITSELTSDEFWEEVNELGGLPNEILEEKELREFYEIILRADFKLIEEYVHQNNSKLNIPIDVFFGSDEDHGGFSEIKKWEEESNSKVNFFKLTGDHFFIFNHLDSLVRHMSRETQFS